MNLSQLYGSGTAVNVVCQGVCKISAIRFLICRDLLILQQLLLRLGDAVSRFGKAAHCTICGSCLSPSTNIRSFTDFFKA